jgi:hypothetical protein
MIPSNPLNPNPSPNGIEGKGGFSYGDGRVIWRVVMTP